MARAYTIPATQPGISFDDLLEIERTVTRRADRPTSLSLSDIHEAPNVFQLRRDNLNRPSLNNDHVRTLVSALQGGEMYLEELLVTPIGDKFYLIDGHHRFAAYTALEWSKAIPVNISDEGVTKAVLEAGYGNHRDKQPVSKESKLEFAWTLVRRETYSIAEINRSSGMSPRTISNMRTKLKAITDRSEDAWDYTWKGVLSGNRTSETFEFDAWVDRKSDELSQRMLKDTSLKLVKNPEVLARAILKISDQLPGLLREEWGMGPDDDDHGGLDI